MSELRFMTPAEARQKKDASLEPKIKAARERLNEEIERSGGEPFQIDAHFIHADAVHKLASELADAGWSIRRVSDQRDGDYYDIRPVG